MLEDYVVATLTFIAIVASAVAIIFCASSPRDKFFLLLAFLVSTGAFASYLLFEWGGRGRW